MRLAAIDLGSNALRVTIAEDGSDYIDIIEKYRFPIRLGEQVFGNSSTINKTYVDYMVFTFKQIQKLLKSQHVKKVKAVATSALREATNSYAVIDRIYTESGIKLELISGKQEAKFIHVAVQDFAKEKDINNALLMDIGGGSIEFTWFHKNKKINSISYPLGTVRALELYAKSKDQYRSTLDEYLNTIKKSFPNLDSPVMVGTGGNFRRILKLLRRHFDYEDTYLGRKDFLFTHQTLSQTSYLERITDYHLKPDSADVIVPASEIIYKSCEAFNVKKIEVPKIGLVNGLLLEICS